MACDIVLDKSIGEQCTKGQGGNSIFYPFNFIVDAFTVVAGEATAMNVALTEAFSFAISTGDGNTLSQPLVADSITGNKVCTQTMVAQLLGETAAGNDTLDKFAGAKTSGVLKGRDGKYRWLAADEGFQNITVDPTTGGARNDFKGSTITTVSITGKVAPILDDATVTAFLAVVTAPV